MNLKDERKSNPFFPFIKEVSSRYSEPKASDRKTGYMRMKNEDKYV